MRKQSFTLIFLLITILLLTACGSKTKSLPDNPNPDEISAFIHNSFPMPDGFESNSIVNWKATNPTNTTGQLTINLVAADPTKVDTTALVQGFLDQAKLINKDGKVSIEKLDVQISDLNRTPLLMVNYVRSGQGFDGTGWSAEGIPPLQGVVQDPNLTYPIQPIAPVVEPTPYP